MRFLLRWHDFFFCFFYDFFPQIKPENQQHNYDNATGSYRYRFPCTECDKWYTTRSQLNRHMQLHTGHFTHYCQMCRKGFNVSSNYIDHVRAHQGLKYQCGHCLKEFKTNKSYWKHLSSEACKMWWCVFIWDVCYNAFKLNTNHNLFSDLVFLKLHQIVRVVYLPQFWVDICLILHVKGGNLKVEWRKTEMWRFDILQMPEKQMHVQNGRRPLQAS